MRNTFFLYFRMIFVLLVSLYTSRVVLEVLGVVDYGIYNVVGGIVSFMAFFNTSLSNVSQRYINIGLGEKNPEKTSLAFAQSLTLFLLVSLTIVLLAETLGVWFVDTRLTIPPGREYAAFWVLQFSLLSMVCTINQVTFMSDIVANESMGIYAYLGVFEALAKLSIVLALRVFGSGDSLVLYAALIAFVSLVTTLFYIIYCRRRFPEARLRMVWHWPLVKEMGRFMGYNLYGCFCWTAGFQGANVLLNIFFGPTINAARGLAMQINSVILRFAVNLSMAFKAQVMQSFAVGQIEYMTSLLKKCSVYSFLCVFFLALPVVSNIDFVLALWLKEVPPFTAVFVCLVILDSLFVCLSDVLWLGTSATGEIRRNQVYGRSLMLVGLVVSYMILKIHADPLVPFIVTILVSILYLVYSLFDLRMQIGLSVRHYFSAVVKPLSIVAFSLGFSIILICLFVQQGFVRLLCVVAAELAVGLPIIYLKVLDGRERNFVRNKLLGFLGRKG